MTAIERAEALLANAEQEANDGVDYVLQSPLDQGKALRRLDFVSLDTLRGYIGAVEALEAMRSIVDESVGVAGWHLNGAIAEWGEFEFEEGMEQSIADFERLFPEAPASAD